MSKIWHKSKKLSIKLCNAVLEILYIYKGLIPWSAVQSWAQQDVVSFWETSALFNMFCVNTLCKFSWNFVIVSWSAARKNYVFLWFSSDSWWVPWHSFHVNKMAEKLELFVMLTLEEHYSKLSAPNKLIVWWFPEFLDSGNHHYFTRQMKSM